MKKFAILALVLVVAVTCVFGFAACGDPYEGYDYAVAIAQPMEHVALSQARTAFIEELTARIKADGKTVYFDYQNALGNISDLGSILDNFIGRQPDIIYAIATDAAQQAAQKTLGTDIDVIFNAVTDPVLSNIVSSMTAPGGNVTGVSDMNPMDRQVELMQMLMGGGTDFTVGVLYTNSEQNSVTQRDTIASICQSMGIECISRGIPDANELPAALASLKNQGADILYLPTDNLLASIASNVHSTNVQDGINLPIVCGEGGMNDACGVATLSVDYNYLGRLAAGIAYDILVGGKDPSEIAVLTQTEDLAYSVNEKVASDIGFTIPDEVKALVTQAD